MTGYLVSSVVPNLSQMPTLGEFIERARRSPYHFTKGAMRDPDLGRIVFLRREQHGSSVELIDLPPGPETQRLTRNTLESLCRKTGILPEDFGLEG